MAHQETEQKSNYLKGVVPRGFRSPDPNVRWFMDAVKSWDQKSHMWMSIIGIPFDGGTVSARRGSRYAPSRIREYLYSLTTYNIEHDSDITQPLYDCGDVEVDIVDFDETMRRLRLAAQSVFGNAEHVIALGGDHSLTNELIRAARNAAGEEIGVVQFDAHHDMRTKWGHHSGFWLRALVDDGTLKGENVYQIGVRGSLYSPYYTDYLRQKEIRYLTAYAFHEIGVEKALAEIADRLKHVKEVYVTFDIDAVDQAFAPGTDHPSAGGLSSDEALRLVYGLASRLSVRWLDVMEVSPPHDIAEQTVGLAGELAMQFIHARCKESPRKET